MSAQLTLTDAEMDALQKCILAAQEVDGGERLSPDEARAALSAYRKFTPHLRRACRRKPRP